MTQIKQTILAIKADLTTIKFAVYRTQAGLEPILYGKIAHIGLSTAHLSFTDARNTVPETLSLKQEDYQAACDFLLDWLDRQELLSGLLAVGHGVVLGGQQNASVLLTQAIYGELLANIRLAPEYLPLALWVIKSLKKRYPGLRQIACFDSAFHQNMPRVAKILPIPRRYQQQGVERYGFDGLSFSYLVTALHQLGEAAVDQGRVILAHLGSNTSLTALLNGQSIDTTMGFSLASGIGSEALEPQVFTYLARLEKLSVNQLSSILNQQSGLLGISELSADMRDCLAEQNSDVRAAEAVAWYCYQVKKAIGSYAAALGGLDCLVFSGGIGVHEALIRSTICQDLGFLGLALDNEQNINSAAVISSQHSSVRVRVIASDAVLSIARAVQAFI